MGEKRGRAEADGDERKAPTDWRTGRTAGMTGRRDDGTRSEAGRYRKRMRRFNQLKTQARKREQRDDRR